jgi:hypothetical protein
VTPLATVDVIAESVRASLAQVTCVSHGTVVDGTVIDGAAIARAIAGNAAQALARDRLGALLRAVRELGPDVLNVGVSPYPDGSASVCILTTSGEAVAEVSEMLGCAPPRKTGNEGKEWIVAELGDCDDPLRITVIGGYQDACPCEAAVAARKAG